MEVLTRPAEPREARCRGRTLARVAGLFLTIAAPILAQTDSPPSGGMLEYQIKAAFLYNFAKFVEWPAEKLGDGSAPIVIAVIGKDPFGPVLDQTLIGKTVNGRALVVRRVVGLPDLRRCHIAFISSSEKGRLSEILPALAGAGVLTVGDAQRFAEQGGMISFVTEENKVRLEINVEAATRAGVQISSKLLKLARVVRNEAEARRD